MGNRLALHQAIVVSIFTLLTLEIVRALFGRPAMWVVGILAIIIAAYMLCREEPPSHD